MPNIDKLKELAILQQVMSGMSGQQEMQQRGDQQKQQLMLALMGLEQQKQNAAAEQENRNAQLDIYRQRENNSNKGDVFSSMTQLAGQSPDAADILMRVHARNNPEIAAAIEERKAEQLQARIRQMGGNIGAVYAKNRDNHSDLVKDLAVIEGSMGASDPEAWAGQNWGAFNEGLPQTVIPMPTGGPVTEQIGTNPSDPATMAWWAKNVGRPQSVGEPQYMTGDEGATQIKDAGVNLWNLLKRGIGSLGQASIQQ